MDVHLSLPQCVHCSSAASPRGYGRESVSIRETARELTRMRLQWSSPPQAVLLIFKEGMAEASSLAQDMLHWIRQNSKAQAYTYSVQIDGALQYDGQVLIDLVITVGGDGTVLLAAWLFQEISPPILPLYCGTLGFLTVYPASSFEAAIKQTLEGGSRMNVRMRMTAAILSEDGTILSRRTVLNDLVVDRGASQHMAQVEIHGDGHYLTTVSGDGVVIATPTGSTAYSMSAGGSVTHPDVPGLLITPICPHSLSFRPLIVPDWIEIRLMISEANRADCLWVSFDGRERLEVRRHQSISIGLSPFPVSTICADNPTADWLNSLARCLAWNQR